MTPFFDGLVLKFNHNSNKTMLGVTLGTLHGLYSSLQKEQNNYREQKIHLFNLIPFINIKRKKRTTKYKLFGFIPLFKKREK